MKSYDTMPNPESPDNKGERKEQANTVFKARTTKGEGGRGSKRPRASNLKSAAGMCKSFSFSPFFSYINRRKNIRITHEQKTEQKHVYKEH